MNKTAENEFMQQRSAESIARIDKILSSYEGKLHQDLKRVNTSENRAGMPEPAVKIADNAGCSLVEASKLYLNHPAYSDMIESATSKKVFLFTENVICSYGYIPEQQTAVYKLLTGENSCMVAY